MSKGFVEPMNAIDAVKKNCWKSAEIPRQDDTVQEEFQYQEL